MIVSKQLKLVGELAGENVRESLGLPVRYTHRRLTDPEDIQESRRLSTAKFVELGKIPAEAVGPDGILVHDHLLPMSTFFGSYASSGELLVTGRLLWTPSTTVEDLRLPLEDIGPQFAQFLRDQPAGTVAEIGSLAKKDREVSTTAELKLLRSMWQFASQSGIEYFICGLEPKIYPSFRASFGNALTELVEGTVEFPGIVGQQKPLMISVREAVADQNDTGHRSMAQQLQRKIIGRFIVKGAVNVITHR